jgi:hypothetical protein
VRTLLHPGCRWFARAEFHASRAGGDRGSERTARNRGLEPALAPAVALPLHRLPGPSRLGAGPSDPRAPRTAPAAVPSPLAAAAHGLSGRTAGGRRLGHRRHRRILAATPRPRTARASSSRPATAASSAAVVAAGLWPSWTPEAAGRLYPPARRARWQQLGVRLRLTIQSHQQDRAHAAVRGGVGTGDPSLQDRGPGAPRGEARGLRLRSRGAAGARQPGSPLVGVYLLERRSLGFDGRWQSEQPPSATGSSSVISGVAWRPTRGNLPLAWTLRSACRRG